MNGISGYAMVGVEEFAEPVVEADLVAAVIAFANGAELPAILSSLPGAFQEMPNVTVVNRTTGVPTATGVEARRERLRADLVAIASGKLARARKSEIAAQADRVTLQLKGTQRRMRPAFVLSPDLQAAVGYVTHVIATRQYAKRLGWCQLRMCGRFFLRTPSRGKPGLYCPGTDHADREHALNGPRRAQDTRDRKKATKDLRAQYPARARELINAVKEPGLSVEELLRRARAHAARHPQVRKF